MRQALASRTIDGKGDGSKPSAVPPPTPEEIADRFPQFEILECLGRGGMGVVYKARQKSLNRLVAIKILAPERASETRFAERFAREAEILAQLNQPHIVTIHDFGETGGLFYLVMEFVDGVNLRDLLRDGKLEAKQALAIVPPICEALQYAHDKGIVHRDIKPENLLLDREGRIKIADFGIAALMGADSDIAGTPPYMAPEQDHAAGGIDHRADIYALGVVLYEMLTGERPAKDAIAPSKKVEVDVRLDEVVLRSLESRPELRFQQVSEVKTLVESIAGSSAERRSSATDADAPNQRAAAGGSPDAPSKTWSRKRKLSAVFGLLVVVTLVLRVQSCLRSGPATDELRNLAKQTLAERNKELASSAEFNPNDSFGRVVEQDGMLYIGALNRPAAESPKSSFGAIRESVINDLDDEKGEEALDLRSGKLSSIPAEANGDGRAMAAWFQTNQSDLSADHAKNRWALMTRKLVLLEMPDRRWDDLKTEDIDERLSESSSNLEVLERSGQRFYLLTKEAKPPLLFAFETERGDQGVLEITGFAQKPRSVKLRYKLIQDSP